jgi:hypothetical protein
MSTSKTSPAQSSAEPKQQLITRGRDGAPEEINLTPDEHLALKARLTELRRPAATAENEEWRQRAATLNTEGRAIRSFLKRLAAVKEGPMEYSPALFGLLGLYEFMDGDVDEHVGTNWLGKFIFDLLARVAYSGAAAVANDPDSVMERLETEIESIKKDVRDCRDIVNKYPGILAEVNAEPGQSE